MGESCCFYQAFKQAAQMISHSFSIPFLFWQEQKSHCAGQKQTNLSLVFGGADAGSQTQAGACGSPPSAAGDTSLSIAKSCGHLTLWHLYPAVIWGKAANKCRESEHKTFFLRETNEKHSLSRPFRSLSPSLVQGQTLCRVPIPKGMSSSLSSLIQNFETKLPWSLNPACSGTCWTAVQGTPTEKLWFPVSHGICSVYTEKY